MYVRNIYTHVCTVDTTTCKISN